MKRRWFRGYVSSNSTRRLFERAVVIIMDSFVSKCFICTAHGDVVAVPVPADIYFVTRHAIEVRERAFNGSAVDLSGSRKLFPIREQETFGWLLHTLLFITEQQE